MVVDTAIVGFRFRHHGKHSGYDQIVSYLENVYYLNRNHYDLMLLLKNVPLPSRIVVFLNKIRDWLFYFKLRKICSNTNIKYIHFIYPENTLAFCPFEIPCDKIVIATFHQPLEFFEHIFRNCSRIEVRNFRRVNKAILLSKDKIFNFKELTGIENIVFIPHGVNRDFFRPSPNLRESNCILFLGNWLRDFEIASIVFRKLNKQFDYLKIIVICDKEFHCHFMGINGITLLHSISDSELLIYLQSVSLLFLPLKGATANNAIIESASCGLPIVATGLPAIEDYINSDSITQIDINESKDVEGICKLLINLLNDEIGLTRQSILIRKATEHLCWRNITKITRQYYSL